MDFSLISSPIRTFQSMVQCAMNTLESVPREDLLIAFKTSINLLERIGEIINHNVNITNISSSSGLLNNVDQNSFLNSFTNHNGEPSFRSQSSPLSVRHQESLMFSNRLSFPNSESIPVSCILPISSSQTLAALNGLMKNGILSNNENLLNSRSASDDNTSGPSSENTSETNSPYLGLLSNTGDKKLPARQTLWHNRSRSPVSSLLKNESIVSPLNLQMTNHNDDDDNDIAEGFVLNSKIEKRKNMNSDELNRLLDSCEVKSDGVLGGKKNYKCKFCGKMYDIKSSIRYHIRIIHLKMHLKTADMQCKLCGRVFTCATAANKHQLRCLKIGNLDGGSGECKSTDNINNNNEDSKEITSNQF